MPASITDKLRKTRNGLRPVVTYLTSPKAIGAATISVNALDNWPTDTAVDFVIVRKDANSKQIGGTLTTWKGTVTGTTINNLTIVAGDDQSYVANEQSVVIATPTAAWSTDLIEAILVHANQDGSLKTSAVLAALNITGNTQDWNATAAIPSAVTYNGNGSYDLTVGTDLTGTVSPGSKIRTQRSVPAPTQSTLLNGTTQYYSKTSPSGMTYTDDFVVFRHIKPTGVYQQMTIESRYNGTSGWEFRLEASGQIALYGYNGGSTNFKVVQSLQSVPLNKWSHVAAQLDMSAISTNGTGISATTNYIMLDGVSIPCTTFTSGTGPTSLIQAGNYEVGSRNGGQNPFVGAMATGAVSSTKITQANIKTLIPQGLTPALITANNIISAYSFDNNINDLNTSTANNLTANGGAVATNPESPFGTQANNTISSTLDYGVIQKITSTTITVQVPNGCTIPVSGGVAALSYSGLGRPFGFPAQKGKWQLTWIHKVSETSVVSAGAYNNQPSFVFPIPQGEWMGSFKIAFQNARVSSTFGPGTAGLSTSTLSYSDSRLVTGHYHASNVSTIAQISTFTLPPTALSIPSVTTYYLTKFSQAADGDFGLRSDIFESDITFENALV